MWQPGLRKFLTQVLTFEISNININEFVYPIRQLITKNRISYLTIPYINKQIVITEDKKIRNEVHKIYIYIYIIEYK